VHVTDESRGPEVELLSRVPVFDGRIVHLSVDTVRFPDGGTVALETISHAGASAVVPFLDDPMGSDPRVVLLHQYRHAAGGRLYEVPAGMPASPNELWAACARRELAEETGFEANDLRYLSRIFTTPGFTNEVIHLFAASGLTPGDQRPDRDELFEVTTLPLSTAVAWVRDGKIVDAKSAAALLFVWSFRHEVWPQNRGAPSRGPSPGEIR
jgi:ADP-ribose pyrophosphatase